jgi:hypothetical protein
MIKRRNDDQLSKILCAGKEELFNEEVFVPVQRVLFVNKQYGLFVSNITHASVRQCSIIIGK